MLKKSVCCSLYKKKLHLEHYTQYLDEFLLRMGKDADLDENDVLSLDELEGLKEYRLYLNGVDL